MNPRIRKPLVAVIGIVSLIGLLAASARAQAGLSGNAFGGQEEERLMQQARNTKFDNGKMQSTSALGQLEELTGSKVDRSSTSTSTRTTNTRATQQVRVVKPKINTEQVLRQQVTSAVAGALVGALFDGLFNDNSAQQRAQAEAEAAARAAAEAEALRVQQELARQARIQRAQHYRAEWDSREGEITNRLGGAFDVGSSQNVYRNFFGSGNVDPNSVADLIGLNAADASAAAGSSDTASDAMPGAAPDAVESDASVVDLRGSSSLVVQPLRQGVVTTKMPARSSGSLTPRWAYEWPDPNSSAPRYRDPTQVEMLVRYFSPWLADYYKEIGSGIKGEAESLIKEKLFGKPPGYRGKEYVSAVKSFNSDRKEMGKEAEEMTEPLTDFSGVSNAALALGSAHNSGAELIDENNRSLQEAGNHVVVGAWKMIYNRIKGRSGEFKLLEEKEEPGFGEGGDVVPVNDVPEHADSFRVNNILFGRK